MKNFPKTNSEHDFRGSRKMPFVSEALCYDRFFISALTSSVKEPGKFMWKRKQLLCISFAILLLLSKSACMFHASTHLNKQFV